MVLLTSEPYNVHDTQAVMRSASTAGHISTSSCRSCPFLRPWRRRYVASMFQAMITKRQAPQPWLTIFLAFQKSALQPRMLVQQVLQTAERIVVEADVSV